jgi:glucose-6-phosphate 1-dehydrogenase
MPDDHVQITVAETVGLEGRTDYYDSAGALRDMVQNHLLQLLALVAIEPPSHFDATAVRDEKVKVLRSLGRIGAEDTVSGQYAGGAVHSQPVPAYADELGGNSGTETFVALKAHVDNWRWAGVPFYLRTGKRCPSRRTEVVIQFRSVPHSMFASRGASAAPNRLIIAIQPEENITLELMTKQPGLDRSGIRVSAEKGLPEAVGVDLMARESALAPPPPVGTGRELFAVMRSTADDAEAGASAMLHAMEAEQA